MNSEQQWQIVLERDTRFADRFVYAVSSTKIFCRPTCAARRPNRERVSFFDSAIEAQSAGFRACKRCRPLDESNVARVVERVANGEASSTKDARAFQALAGVSPREYKEATQLKNFKTELQSGKSVLDASLEAGYGSMRAVYERAPSQLGMTPASYGKGGLGARIRFSTARCELGHVLVARTEVGVCSVALGDDESELETQLREEFSRAEISRDDESLKRELELVVSSTKGQTDWSSLPLDVQATAFQWRVWRELGLLKRGETVSYGELANRMDLPKSVRAVAAACGRNPVALVHPCHRVVGKDGALTGYRWGLERKRLLLELEKN